MCKGTKNHRSGGNLRRLPSLFISLQQDRTKVVLVGGSAPFTPVVANASRQMELLKREAAVQTSGCRKCLELSSGMRTGGRPACKGCALVEDLLHQVAQMQEVVRRLHNIREVEMDTWFQLQSAVDP